MAVLVAVETVVLVLLAVLVAGLLRSHAEILRRLHTLGAGFETDVSDGRSRRAPAARRCPAYCGARARARHRRRRAARRRGARPDRRRRSPHAARVPLERLLDVPHLLGRVRRCGCAAPPRRRPHRGRHQRRAARRASARCATSRRRTCPSSCRATAWETYSVPGSPYFVLVDGASGSVRGEGTGATWPQVFSLITQATNDAAIALGDDLATDLRIDQELLATGSDPVTRACIRGPSRRTRTSERDRPCRRDRRAAGGVRRAAQHLVALRRVDAREHQPARGAGPEPALSRHRRHVHRERDVRRRVPRRRARTRRRAALPINDLRSTGPLHRRPLALTGLLLDSGRVGGGRPGPGARSKSAGSRRTAGRVYGAGFGVQLGLVFTTIVTVPPPGSLRVRCLVGSGRGRSLVGAVLRPGAGVAGAR